MSIRIAVLLGALSLHGVNLGAQSPARIAEGQVLRAVAGGDAAAVTGHWVVLHRVGADRAGPLDSARTGAGGRFRFRYVASGAPDALYFVSATYGGIAYFAPPLRSAVVRGGDADIMVYDTTNDTTALRMQGRHVVVSLPRGSKREIAEIFEIENQGPRTVIARDSIPVWTTTLPADAEGMAVAPGDVSAAAVAFKPGRAELYAPLSPGIRQLVLTYSLPATSFPVAIPLERATSVIEVLMEDPRGEVVGSGLAEVAPATIEGRTFRRFIAQDAAASAVVRVNAPAPARENAATLRALLLVLAALMAGALVVWALRRPRAEGRGPRAEGREPRAESREPPAASREPRAESQALIAEIAALDARHDRADKTAHDEASYARVRAELKARLADALAAEDARA